MEADSRVLLTGQHQERAQIFLWTTRRPLLSELGDEDNGAHERCLSLRVNRYGWRQEVREWITGLVARAGTGRSDVSGNTLRCDLYPFTVARIIPLFRKLQLPECGVDAHAIF